MIIRPNVKLPTPTGITPNGVIYSVWSPNKKAYDYYEAPGDHSGTPNPTHVGPSYGKVGVSSTQAGWRLPSGARKIGSGDLAKGMVATGDTDATGSPALVAIGLAIAAYGLYRVMGPKR